jgi:xanthine dehydrogenase accessory factor
VSSIFDEVRRLLRAEEKAVLLTVLEGERAGAKLLVREGADPMGDAPAELADLGADALARGRSGIVEHEGVRVFADVYGPPPQLIVFGAVDTADALCATARALGWSTVVADARAAFATRERLPNVGEIVVGWPDEVLAKVRPDGRSAILVLTHEDRFDLPALMGALASDAFYIGALGSRRAQRARRERLLRAGLDEDALARIHGPCGLDIGAESPAETAVSIMAEILAVRAGRRGGQLQTSTMRIHSDEVAEEAAAPSARTS